MKPNTRRRLKNLLRLLNRYHASVSLSGAYRIDGGHTTVMRPRDTIVAGRTVTLYWAEWVPLPSIYGYVRLP